MECFLNLNSPFRQFKLQDNVKVKALPEGAFGNLTFQEILIYNTSLRKIHPSVILNSKDRLVDLTIAHSRLEVFPFRLLPALSELKRLWLQNNSLSSVPALQSESLEVLYLYSNNIKRVEEDGWSTPNLRELQLSE